MPDTQIAVSGASGLIGKSLCAALEANGGRVLRLVRHKDLNSMSELFWDPAEGFLTPERLNGCSAVVHLAGESIAGGRWTDQKKQRIRRSRVDGTATLARTLAGLDVKPEVLVCASAIGFYGDRGDEPLSEESESGSGFLADVCREWEAAADPAREAGIRVVSLRTAMVLSSRGGALQKMLTPFRLGAGGVIGSGKQFWSWIHLDDVVGLIRHAITNPAVTGPLNLSAPEPVTNAEFTKTLGRVLHRPTVMPMPAFMARAAFGEMANELMLASARVLPKKAEQTGYQFRFPELEPALQAELA